MWGRCGRCRGFSFSLNEVHICIDCEMKRAENERFAASLCRRKHEHGCSKERCHRDTDVWDSREAWKRDDDAFTTIATIAVASSLLSERPQVVETMDMKVEDTFQGGESGGGGASSSFGDSSDSGSSDSSYSSDSGGCSDSGGGCGGGD